MKLVLKWNTQLRVFHIKECRCHEIIALFTFVQLWPEFRQERVIFVLKRSI